MVISPERLAELLERTVELTEDFPVQNLEDLYRQLNICISQNKDKLDRAQLPNVSLLLKNI